MAKKITSKSLGVDLKDPKAFSDTLWGQCLRFPEKTAPDTDLTGLIQGNVNLVNAYLSSEFTMCLSRHTYEAKEDPFVGLQEQVNSSGWGWFPPLVAFFPPGFYMLKYDPAQDRFSFAPVRDGPMSIAEELVYLNERDKAGNQLRVSPWVGHTDGGSPYVGGLGNDRSYASQARNVHIFLGDHEVAAGCSRLKSVIEDYGLEIISCTYGQESNRPRIWQDIARLAVRAKKEGITLITQDEDNIIPSMPSQGSRSEYDRRKDLTRAYALEVYHRFFIR